MNDDIIQKAAEAMWDAIDNKGILGRLCREDCDYLAQALADAGLLPTETETRRHYGCLENEVVEPCDETAQTRNTTPWKDAS